jgi:hypothetical protein
MHHSSIVHEEEITLDPRHRHGDVVHHLHSIRHEVLIQLSAVRKTNRSAAIVASIIPPCVSSDD